MGAHSTKGGNYEQHDLGLVGLHNFQNTCYMNASLQCLAHTPLLAHHFLQYHKQRGLPVDPNLRSSPLQPTPSVLNGSSNTDENKRGDSIITSPLSSVGSRPAHMHSQVSELAKTPPPQSLNNFKFFKPLTNEPPAPGQLADEFAQINHAIWRGTQPYVKPRDFKDLVDRIDSRFRGVRDQHDAFEFLLEVLLAKLHQDLVAVSRQQKEVEMGPMKSIKDPLLNVVPATYLRDKDPIKLPAAAASLRAGSNDMVFTSTLPPLSGGSKEGAETADKRPQPRMRHYTTRSQLQREDLTETFRQIAAATWSWRLSEKGRSVFTEHFHGQYKKLVSCTQCDTVAVSFPLFVYIDLPLKVKEDLPISLASLLVRHCNNEEVVDDFKCPNCAKNNRPKSKGLLKLGIWKLPDIIMFRLGRVYRRPGHEDDKINHPVSFPIRSLDLKSLVCKESPFLHDLIFSLRSYSNLAAAAVTMSSATTSAPNPLLSPAITTASSSSSSSGSSSFDRSPVSSPNLSSSVNTTSPTPPSSSSDSSPMQVNPDTLPGMYDLYAVLQHQGDTPKHGHYVADVQSHANGRFYSFNDKRIQPSAELNGPNSSAESAQAYILFYQARYCALVHQAEWLAEGFSWDSPADTSNLRPTNQLPRFVLKSPRACRSC